VKKAMVIYNPSSGKEEAHEYKQRALEVLQSIGYKTVEKETKQINDATEFAILACEEQYDLLVALGGDGTISEVINGLAPQQSRPLFTFVPLGTVNDFARAVGIPLEPSLAIEALKMENIEYVDVGKIGDKYFINVVAIGDIASNVAETTIEQKTKYGSLAYLISGAKALINHEEVEMVIHHDQGVWRGKTLLVLVALTNSVGGFKNLVNSAKINDGKLHVFVIKQSSIVSLARLGAKLVLGNLGEDEEVESFTTKNLRIEANRELFCNVDGEQGSCTPFDIEVYTKYLKMLIPKVIKH